MSDPSDSVESERVTRSTPIALLTLSHHMRFPFAILLAAGCGAARPPARAMEPSSTCVLERASQPRDTIVVGSSERLDADGATYPATGTERLVFAALYEALIAFDCDGRALPALASSWSVDSGGRSWTFTLREGARFSDGTPVSIANVLRSWDAPQGDIGSASQLLTSLDVRLTMVPNAVTLTFS
ncbi:MAG TPA: ABC transporter substrate-binding protein, partial [Gemmatimonadaceae bacterium]|nr:ABC transporter substrate-binding protein [Gemmatimonadaceae bacterium]